MKNNLSTALSAAACMLALICFFRLSGISQEIHSVNNSLSNHANNITNSVNRITSIVNESMERQASLLTSSSWQLGDVKAESLTVNMTCRVIPKQYSPNSTQAAIVFQGVRYPMTLKNGEFETQFDIGLFKNIEDMRVEFTEGDIISSQRLDWYINPRYDYLPELFGRWSGSTTSHKLEGGGCLIGYNGSATADVSGKEGMGITAIELVAVADGQEILRLPLASPEGRKQAASPEPATSVMSAAGEYTYGEYELEFTRDFELPAGTMSFELYLEAADEYGLRYRSYLDCRSLSAVTGELEINDDEWQWSGKESYIYDADGNLLFDPAS